MKTSFPRELIRCVLLEGVHTVAAEMLGAEGFRVERIGRALDGDELREAARDAHLVGIRSKSRVGGDLFGAAPRLLSVGCFCIGTNQVDVRGARLAGVPVFNSPFSNTRSVAELTIAEVIALHRRLPDCIREMHGGRWRKTSEGAHEVRGRTLGIVGYGRIGSQVSVLAEAVGMRVVFFDAAPVLALGNARPCASLGELLSVSDVVTLHVPATRATAGLVGEREIAQMRRGASLINNARGTVVDLCALAAAIRDGRVGGAAVDVFPDEPAAGDDDFACALRGLPNVILTPHVGGSTEEAQEAIARDVATKLIRFVNNGSTTGAVNVPQVELPEQGRVVVPAGEEGGGREAGARPHRVLHFHRNVPGVLSKMHAAISEIGANVAAEYLRTDEDVGYVVLDVDPSDGEAIEARLKEIPETIRVRLLW